MSAHFFLTYANADQDGYVGKFFTDLTREVQQLTGMVDEGTGFRDRSSMAVGANWPQELLAALSSARALVALFSPSYFASEFCGREWAMYASRLERHRLEHGHRPPTLLPVLWVPSPSMPEPVRHLQYDHESLGGTYAKEGLLHLARLKRYRDEYVEVLRRLAQRLVEVTSRYLTPPLDPGFPVADTVSAFHVLSNTGPAWQTLVTETVAPLPRETVGRQPAPAPSPSRSGPRHVNFVIVSAPSREMAEASVREELRQYGVSPFDWVPYWPELDQRISVFVQAVAVAQDLSSGLAEAGELQQILDRAAGRNEVVVILVDIWTTRIDTYRDHMLAYDLRNEPSSAVMVPWSRQDRETTANSDLLYADLRRALPRNMRRGGELFRYGIETPAQFKDDLADVLARVQTMVFREGEVGRRAGGTSLTERPTLQFPDPEDY